MTETPIGGPKNPPSEAFPPEGFIAGDTLGIPRTPGWKLKRQPQEQLHVREVALWQMAPQLREALRATILPKNATIVSLTVTWQDGPAPSS